MSVLDILEPGPASAGLRGGKEPCHKRVHNDQKAATTLTNSIGRKHYVFRYIIRP
jgi:hypothetical protein